MKCCGQKNSVNNNQFKNTKTHFAFVEAKWNIMKMLLIIVGAFDFTN